MDVKYLIPMSRSFYEFPGIMEYAYFWTFTEYQGYAFLRYLGFDHSKGVRSYTYKYGGMSVRSVREQ